MKTSLRTYWWIGCAATFSIVGGYQYTTLQSQAAPNTRPTTPNHKHHKHHNHKHHHHHHAAPKAAKVKFPDRSLYQVNATWTNQDGVKIKFASLKGKVRVIALIYTSCRHACPVIISDIKKIEQSIPKAMLDKFGIVLVTIDPKRDTPKTMKAFRDQHKLSPKRWTFLHGTPDQILELAVLLGVKYKKTSKTDYAHSNIITTLDQKGVIKYRQLGLAQNPKKTVDTIKQLLKHKHKHKHRHKHKH